MTSDNERFTIHSHERNCQIGYAATAAEGWRKLNGEDGYVWDTRLQCHVFPTSDATKNQFFESIRESKPEVYALWQARENLPHSQDAAYWALTAGIAACIGGDVQSRLAMMREWF